jgi:protein-disulfide isomerase
MIFKISSKPVLALAALMVVAGCSGDADNATSANGSATAGAGAIAPPAGTEWATTINATPEGGFVMGNPNAPVKLVEYLSLTCAHCAEFASQAFIPLRDKYIQKGTVSFEIRNYVRDPIDVAAALVTRCNGAGPYFQLTEQMLEGQTAMIERAQAIDEAEFRRIGGLQPGEQFKALAAAVGIDQFARQRGIGADKANACLGDQAGLDQLVAMQKTANDEIQIQGTPSFLINGKLTPNAGTWEALEPLLVAAGA